MSNIVLYKLSTGEEIIARIEEERDSAIVLSSVRTIMIQPTGDGRIGIALMPFMAGAADNKIRVYTRSIVSVTDDEIPKQIEDMYLQQTSGIDLSSGAANVSRFDPNARK